MANGRALLLIADIGGYTRFMTVHRINLSHAQVLVARLLEAVIDAARPALKLSKLEGDAAFFYAPLPDGAPGPDLAALVARIRRAFLARRDELANERLCSCDACTQTGQLKLKFVSHAGEVAYQKVKRLTELAGVDVILVHRMLKNHVPISEYVLMSGELHGALPDPIRAQAQSQREELEGLGEVELHYLELAALESLAPATPPKPRGLFRSVLGWLALTLRSLPFFAGASEPCASFRNLDDVRAAPQLPPAQ